MVLSIPRGDSINDPNGECLEDGGDGGVAGGRWMDWAGLTSGECRGRAGCRNWS